MSLSLYQRLTWALDLDMDDFPYPRDSSWRSGFGRVATTRIRSKDAEGIRDWNLRAVFGAFNAMKNRGGATEHENGISSHGLHSSAARENRGDSWATWC